jgi:hypothetical protein
MMPFHEDPGPCAADRQPRTYHPSLEARITGPLVSASVDNLDP